MNHQKSIDEFFEKIDHLSENERILFRKSFGKRLNDMSAVVLVKFYDILPVEIKESEEEKWVFTACVHCIIDSEDNNGVALDEAIWKYRTISTSEGSFTDSFEKRVIAIMDMKWDEQGMLLVKMAKLIKFLKTKGIAVDGKKLLTDILYWNYEDKRIQKRWAKTYNHYEEDKLC